MVVAEPARRVAPRDPSLVQAVFVDAAVGSERYVATQNTRNWKIGAAEFRSALERSLEHYDLLNRDREHSRYRLTATLLGMDDNTQALFNWTMGSHVRYEVFNRRTDEPYMVEIVSAFGSADMGDAFWGGARRRTANARSIRENIVSFIKKLLDHPAPDDPK